MTLPCTSLFVGCLLALLACVPAHAQSPLCSLPPTPDCLYAPPSRHAFTAYERSTSYTDAAGRQRQVKVMLRVPIGAPMPPPWPVVVWSHGGADGKGSPAHSMVEWSELTAAAGYLTVSIAHAGRDAASREALCRSPALAINDRATCEQFKYLNWDRPHDIRAVLDELERLAAGEFRGQIDLRRIAVGGHSAGSGGALTVAGARRIFVDHAVELSDARPIAFLAFSPQQPGSEGFFDTRFQKPSHSWAHIRRPVLAATGDGDSTCNTGVVVQGCVGDTPFGRRIGFQRMPADGNKYELYLHDANAFHTLFELNAGKCPQLQVPQSFCDDAVRWLSSTALAFLDAHVRQGMPAALQWLHSDRIERASGGVAEWQRQ